MRDIIHFAKKYNPHFRGVFMRDLPLRSIKKWGVWYSKSR